MDGGEGTERCSSISTHALNVNYDSSTQSLSDWDGGTGSSHRFDPSGQSGDMDVTSDVAFLDRSNPPFCGNDALTIGSQGMPCTAQPQASNEGSPWLNVPNAKLLFHMAGPAALGTKAPAELLLKKAIPNGGYEGSTKSKLPRPLSGAFSATQSVQQPGMSWQCFSSLLFTGPGFKHMAEGTAGVQSMNLGPFSKASSVPLVLTVPYAAALREKLLRASLEDTNKGLQVQEGAMEIDSPDPTAGNSVGITAAERRRLVGLQRTLRARLVNSFLDSRRGGFQRDGGAAGAKIEPSSDSKETSNNRMDIVGDSGDAESKDVDDENGRPAYAGRHRGSVRVHPLSGPLTGLLPRWTTGTYRSRRQQKKDVRLFEKEIKRKTLEKEQSVKLRNQLLLKDVLAHRDEFVRFHKMKKADIARIARGVKTYVDSEDARRDREEVRAEERRLKALKENDMVAYNLLVQETKNERLKHLLNQTDGYIQTINQMIESQRAEGAPPGSKPTLTSPGLGQTLSQSGGAEEVGVVRQRSSSIAAAEGSSAQRYLETTHKLSEQVIQPSILKGGDLKEYQLSGLQWLVSLYNNNLNGILADEMGLGKTIQAIALLGYLMEYKHNHGPFLIVVPLSTLSNWSNETAKWVPDMRKVVYKGAPQLRRALYKDEVEGGQFNVLLTTYEYVMKDKALLKKIPWEYIIVDEGHRMKNAQSKFAQILGNHYVSRHRILLTGTPLQNNLPELWALLNFLLPSIFNSVETFDQWFNKPFSTFRQTQQLGQEGGEDMVSLSQEERLLIVQRLHELLRPFMLRRVKDQVLDQLPEKTEIVLRCELSGWQRYLYRSIQQRCVSTIKGINSLVPMKADGPLPTNASSIPGPDEGEDDEEDGNGKAVSFSADTGGGDATMTASGAAGLNNVIMQLRKICNHPYLFMQDWPIDDDIVRTSGKFELLDRMLPKLRAAGHRILMFSQMTQLMTILERFFELKKFPYLRLDGSTTSDDREKRMYQFNDPNSPYFIFLLSTRAGGLGLNLATADTVFLFDSDWNPMMDAQAQDRAHRIGQKNAVRVFRLVSTSPVEERILARATDKLNLTELVVEAGKFNKSSGGNDSQARKEMVEALLAEYSESREQGVAEDAEAGITSESVVQDEDTLNDMMSLHESELLVYQKMDAQKAAETERVWRQTPGGRAGMPIPPRLMAADDLPQWIIDGACWGNKYMKMFGPAQLEEDSVDPSGVYDTTASGRKRRLDSVGGSYSENMSDAQFDVFIGERKGRASVGPGSIGPAARTPGRGRGRGGRSGANTPTTPAAKKPPVSSGRGRGRGRGRGSGAGRAAAPSSSGRGAGGGRGVRVLPGIIPMALTSDLIRISLVLRKIERTDGSLLSFLFIDLPDAKFYPDYYQIVKYPMSLKLMTKKLRDAQYRTVSEITYDMDMMVANASLYNGPGSPVALDAEHITSEWKRLIGGLEIPDNMLVPVDTSTLPTLASMQAAASERAVDEGAVGEESDNNGEEGCDGEDFEEDPVEINNDESALEDRMGLDESNAMPMDMSEDLGDAVDAPPPVKRLKLSLSGSRPAAPEQPLGNTEEALY